MLCKQKYSIIDVLVKILILILFRFCLLCRLSPASTVSAKCFHCMGPCRWLLLVLHGLGRFRMFQIVLNHFRLFQLVPHFSKYLNLILKLSFMSENVKLISSASAHVLQAQVKRFCHCLFSEVRNLTCFFQLISLLSFHLSLKTFVAVLCFVYFMMIFCDIDHCGFQLYVEILDINLSYVNNGFCYRCFGFILAPSHTRNNQAWSMRVVRQVIQFFL